MRCPRKGCQVMRSVRHGTFFHYSDLNNKMNCKLSVRYWMLCISFSVELLLSMPKQLRDDRIQHQLIRTCAGRFVRKSLKMKAKCWVPLKNQQTDEARFAEKRKYNRGRLLMGNTVTKSEDSAAALLETNRNHGRRIDGLWVFGLKQSLDYRYFCQPP